MFLIFIIWDTDLTITVIGINDTPIADNETNSTDVSTTLTVTDGSSDVLAGDTDADADASLTVSAIRTGSSEGSGDAGTIGSALNGDFFLFVSTLMRIKAKMLLPRKEVDAFGNEIDPRQELVDKIIEY